MKTKQRVIFVKIFCMISIQIEVPLYLKQFLISNYGDEYHVDYSDEFGSLVINALRQKTNHSNLQSIKGSNLETYDIKISMSYFKKSGCHIFDKDRIMIVKAIDKWFRNTMYRTAILNYRLFNIPYKTTIVNFLAAYGVTEDAMNYGTIRKDFNRKKKDLESNMKFHVKDKKNLFTK